MRFRATVGREQIRVLLGHLSVLDRIGKNAIIHFSAETIRIIVKGFNDTLLQYSVVNVESIFSEMRIESKTGNVISLEMLVSNLLHALKSADQAEQVLLKLTKRGESPYLACEMSMIENGVNMMQDIPVRVLPQAEMLRHSEPGLPPPDVQCVLPSAAAVASVVERMKTFSKVLFLTGDMGNSSSNAGSGSGGVTLCLSVAQDMVDVRTHFRDLRGAPEGMADARDSGADSALSDLGRQSVRKGRGSGKASAAVDALVFHRVLRSITALPSPADTILGIVTGMAVYVHVPLQDGSGNVTYIMSIVDSGMGEPDAEDGDTGGGGGGGGE